MGWFSASNLRLALAFLERSRFWTISRVFSLNRVQSCLRQASRPRSRSRIECHLLVVDTTSAVGLPYGVSAKAMRCEGLHASFIEAKKRLEYKEWRFGYPNEFVPFALDNTGMLAKTSSRFLRRMKLHAKRMDRFRGMTRFWEALSIGLVKGSAHGFALMARGDGLQR